MVTAGRGAAFVNGQFVGGKAWTAVNGAYTRWGAFAPGWYGGYPGAWWPGKWAMAATAWAAWGWGTAGSYCGCSGEGAYYDYGGNVTYEDETVYYGDQPVASAEQYYDQAEQLADTGQTAQNEEWLPLGVYAVITEPTQTQTDKVIQLAVNKEGVIRGNLHDALADKVIPVVGAVDKKTQRVAVKMEGNDLDRHGYGPIQSDERRSARPRAFQRRSPGGADPDSPEATGGAGTEIERSVKSLNPVRELGPERSNPASLPAWRINCSFAACT